MDETVIGVLGLSLSAIRKEAGSPVRAACFANRPDRGEGNSYAIDGDAFRCLA